MPGFWEKSLLTASLNYVEFPVGERTVQTGRTFARYKYPYRDGQGVEDLGRKVFVWNLTIPLFRGVSPSHYPDTRDRLIAIIEDADLRGEVEYVDPEDGPFQVKIVDYNWQTVADRRDGGVLTLVLEERGFEQSLLQNLNSPELAGRARATALAQEVDFAVAGIDVINEKKPDGGAFSLTATWQAFQDKLDQGALAADEIAAQMDEITLVSQKVLAFSAQDEIERWSIFNSTIDFLGAAQDASDAAVEDASQAGKLVEVVLDGDMSMFDIAQRYLGDAGRAEEVAFDNPGNPFRYARGTRVKVARS